MTINYINAYTYTHTVTYRVRMQTRRRHEGEEGHNSEVLAELRFLRRRGASQMDASSEPM